MYSTNTRVSGSGLFENFMSTNVLSGDSDVKKDKVCDLHGRTTRPRHYTPKTYNSGDHRCTGTIDRARR